MTPGTWRSLRLARGEVKAELPLQRVVHRALAVDIEDSRSEARIAKCRGAYGVELSIDVGALGCGLCVDGQSPPEDCHCGGLGRGQGSPQTWSVDYACYIASTTKSTH